MGVSTEGRQGPDQGFRRRVAQGQRQHAVNWQHAVQVGQALGLGEPLGIYRTEVTPPLGARRVLRLLSPIPVFVFVVVLLMLWAPDAAVPVIGVSPFLAGAYAALVFALTSRRGRYTAWLYGYAGGLAEVDPDGQPRLVRWDEVTDVVDEWSSAGSDSQSLWSYEGFRLTTADGRTVSITAKYENALDPYGPVGGMIAALMPAEVGAAIPRCPSIADLVTDQAVTRVVARQAWAVRGGAVLVRGDVRMTRDGIAGPKDATATPWAAIQRIELRPGHVKVRPIGGKARKYDNYRDGPHWPRPSASSAVLRVKPVQQRSASGSAVGRVVARAARERDRARRRSRGGCSGWRSASQDRNASTAMTTRSASRDFG